MAHLTHLDTHACTILKCFMSCFSTDYKDASVDDMRAVCFEPDRNAAGIEQSSRENTPTTHRWTIIVKGGQGNVIRF